MDAATFFILNAPMGGIEDKVFTLRQLRVYGALTPALYALMLGMLVFRGVWLLNPDGTARGTDFLATWAAGYQALHGAAAAVYGLNALTDIELQAVVELPGYYPWPYPPAFLFAAIPLALLPYLPALLVWIAGTVSAYLAALYAIIPRKVTLGASLALPGVMINAITGQNGLLTAALVGATLALMDRRPAAAGFCLGLLTYKPQFGLLFPLVLALTGRWRVFFAAAATALVLVAASWVVFGAGTWEAFIRAIPGHADVVMGQGQGTGNWSRLQSAYGLFRGLGGSAVLAWSGYAAAALAAAVLVCLTWLMPVRYPLQAAALSLGALVVTPYVFVYDLAVCAVPLAFLVQDGLASGFSPGERTALLCAAAAPVLFLQGVKPAGPVILAVLAGVLVSRIARSGVSPLQSSPRGNQRR